MIPLEELCGAAGLPPSPVPVELQHHTDSTAIYSALWHCSARGASFCQEASLHSQNAWGLLEPRAFGEQVLDSLSQNHTIGGDDLLKLIPQSSLAAALVGISRHRSKKRLQE